MKTLKKLTVLLVLMLSIGVLYGCKASTPTDTTNKYFEKIKNGDADVQKLFTMSEESDKKVKESIKADTFSEDTQKKLLDKLKGITYKVNSESVEGDTAKVNVTVKGMDLNVVLGKVMQEAFTYILTQSFSGVEMSDADNDAYFNSLLIKHLDEVTYSERTADIELTKVDKKWKIKEGNELSKLLIGIDESTFNNENQGAGTANQVAAKTMTLNTPFKVETEKGNYNLTIEGARVTDKRNEPFAKDIKKVVFLDYNYENVSFGVQNVTGLEIDGTAFEVLDDNGNIVDTHPVSDESRKPQIIEKGGKCIASAAFGLKDDSKSLNVTFMRGTQKVAKISVPIK